MASVVTFSSVPSPLVSLLLPEVDAVRLTMTGENAAYSRLYLHNTASEKWQFLNSYKDGTITADTAGSYLLTNQNLRFTNINWTFFIAAGALTVVCLIVYIAVKKRYWFW